MKRFTRKFCNFGATDYEVSVGIWQFKMADATRLKNIGVY